ncbi:MAG TPA: HepT-like ribonuclease domain-containing protein [Burkholderiales bacterium]|nr:HepT-like ribonuclease domain-containing protein [Burkholderiales bacterium]
MRLEARKYLYDIQQAANSIAAFCAGKTFEEYRADDLLRAAVERKFGIVGEALARLQKEDPGSAVRIPEHRKIIAFRNIIIHGYADVDDRIVWGVVEADLPKLRIAVAQLLAEEG